MTFWSLDDVTQNPITLAINQVLKAILNLKKSSLNLVTKHKLSKVISNLTVFFFINGSDCTHN